MNKKKYNKHLKKFRFICADNYDGEVYSYNPETSQMRINPIPVIVELKKDEGKPTNLSNIRVLTDLMNKDLKTAKFKFEHSGFYDQQQLVSTISLLLGIIYGTKKLEEKERKRTDGTTKGNTAI